MSNNALYIYGIIRTNRDWKENGIKENNVFLINEGNFSAIVHRCEEKPYNSANPAEIKDLILTHNRILDKAMENFDAVIPLSFNTIIKSTEKTAEENLRIWLKNNEENLLEIWDKILGKKEYGIRIYYEKEKLLKKIKEIHEIKQLQQKSQIESTGIAYLLKGKIKDEIDKIAQEQIFEYKQNFYNNIKALVSDITINQSKILLDEEKDLLVSISILVNKEQIQKVNSHLINSNFYVRKINCTIHGADSCSQLSYFSEHPKNPTNKQEGFFDFNIAGPFAPYSFVNPQKSLISETPKTGGFCRNG